MQLTLTCCPFCDSFSIFKYKNYKTKYHGNRFLNTCTICKNNFAQTYSSILYRLKTPINIITNVLDSLTEGVGINACTRIFKISKNTIYDWLKKFSGLKEVLFLYSLCFQYIEMVVEGDEFRVKGSLWIPDDMNDKSPGLMQLELDALQLFEKVVLKAYYVKTGLTDFNDAFKFDDRSLAAVRIAYKIYKFIEIGLDYKWTFAVTEDQTWKATNHITPYFGVNIPLNFGGKTTEE